VHELTRRVPSILLVALWAAVGIAGRLGAEESAIRAVDYAEPGNMVQVAVTGDGLDTFSVSLLDSRDRTVSRAEGFRWRTPTGRGIDVALIGVPSTAIPGRHRLVVDGAQGRSDVRLERVLMITDRPFAEQTIRLSDRMDALYGDDSERKKSEARILWAVLTATDPTAIHHLGTFVLPVVDGVPTADYGDRRRYHMSDGTETSSVHFGRDLWAETGSAVRAAGRGRVVLAAERLLTGNTVVVEHLPGVYTLYYHMAEIDVRRGEMVSRGQRIGTIGQTGFATGEHLHWEMRVGATPVDPTPFLEAPLLDTDVLIGIM